MKQKFIVTGMSCAACSAGITKRVSKQKGVKKVDVNLLSGIMQVEFDENIISPEEIASVVHKLGYGAEIKDSPNENRSKTAIKSSWHAQKETKRKELKTMKFRVIFSFVFLIPLLWVSMGDMIGLPEPRFLTGVQNALVNALYQLTLTTIIILINKKFFISGAKALYHREPNMDSLIMLGSGASFIYSFILTFIMAANMGLGNMEKVHSLMHSLYYESAATILSLVTLGKFFEALSKQRTTNALDKLVELSPKTVCVIRNNEEETISLEGILKGDIVLIRPGDIIPADGKIEEGEGYLDQSAITGESMPAHKGIGDSVISASVCKDGSFKFRAESVGEDSTLQQIIKLVEDAGTSKAPIARIADRVSAVFVPIVIAIALISFAVWIIITGNIGKSLQSMISVLVISCPCALGLATPVAIMVAMGKSARMGVLIKSAEALETLCKAKFVVFDKTGTITSGNPAVTDIIMVNGNLEQTIFELGLLEQGSTHPLATAIKNEAQKYEGSSIKTNLTKFKTISGGGVAAMCGKEEWLAGSETFINNAITGAEEQLKHLSQKIEDLKANGKTIVVFAKNKQVQCVLGIADEVRETSEPAISELNNMNVKTILLSGDNKIVADSVAKKVGITETYAEVLPQTKEKVVASFKEKGITIMVGDGINDAPALASADVGIAISSGSDIAKETADIVCTNNSIMGVASAIKLSHATMLNIKINLFWAFFYNALGIPLAAGVFYPLVGWQLSPMIAALAMSLSSVCVVLNALSLNFFNLKKTAKFTQKPLKNNQKKEIYMKKIIKIDGMMCSHCTARVTETLLKIEGISSAEVSLEEGRALVEFAKKVPNKVIKTAIENQGYKVISIEKI